MKFQGTYRAMAHLAAHRKHMRELNPSVDSGAHRSHDGRTIQLGAAPKRDRLPLAERRRQQLAWQWAAHVAIHGKQSVVIRKSNGGRRHDALLAAFRASRPA